MYKQILVALDGSESSKGALLQAVRLAALVKGNLLALHVIDEPIVYTYAGYFDPTALYDALREEGRVVLDDARKSMAEHGVSGEVEQVETDGAGEDVATRIQQSVVSHQADLVVIGTHGRRGIRRMMIGSVAERLLRLSTCPVLLVRAPDVGG
jgi:nucleotide-binding universal stress UspA family protein